VAERSCRLWCHGGSTLLSYVFLFFLYFLLLSVSVFASQSLFISASVLSSSSSLSRSQDTLPSVVPSSLFVSSLYFSSVFLLLSVTVLLLCFFSFWLRVFFSVLSLSSLSSCSSKSKNMPLGSLCFSSQNVPCFSVLSSLFVAANLPCFLLVLSSSSFLVCSLLYLCFCSLFFFIKIPSSLFFVLLLTSFSLSAPSFFLSSLPSGSPVERGIYRTGEAGATLPLSNPRDKVGWLRRPLCSCLSRPQGSPI